MLNVIFENPTATAEIASNIVTGIAVIFFSGSAIWAINGIRKTEV